MSRADRGQVARRKSPPGNALAVPGAQSYGEQRVLADEQDLDLVEGKDQEEEVEGDLDDDMPVDLDEELDGDVDEDVEALDEDEDLEEDDEEESTDDEEDEEAIVSESDAASLEELLAQRTAARRAADDADEDEDEDFGALSSEAARSAGGVKPKSSPLRNREEVQLADAERMLCRDCV
jgi:hypothetical protein